MRIIAGRFKQRRLHTPEGMETRPTLGRVKESLFSMLFEHIEQARVLDLFAGSGALGLEALSRGAKSAVFCDKAKPALLALRRNIDMLQVESETEVIAGDWSTALQKLRDENRQFDLIFIDPPYNFNPAPILEQIQMFKTLGNHGIIILEHGSENKLTTIAGFRISKERQYKETVLTFLEWEDSHEDGALSGQL